MKERTYTILKEDGRGRDRSIFEVLADDHNGFTDFCAEHGSEALPGSTVDIADYKLVLRLRNDGNWEQYKDYATPEEREEIDATAIEAVLDGLLPEEG